MKRDDHTPVWGPMAVRLAEIGSPPSFPLPPKFPPDNVAITRVPPSWRPANDPQFTPPPEYA